MQARKALSLLSALALFAVAILVACSGGGGTGPGKSTGSGTVTTTLSDPATCSAPQGPYSHIFVTVTDVKIHQSATAGANDSGWVDLTPNLTPTQVDLLGTANTTCFLATLGSAVQIPPGTYQQIRVILLDNSKPSQVANNQCGSNAANCVVKAADNSVHPLQLSSEAQTGIKIPSGQLAGGNFTIAAGETRDLNIDFNACASVVIQGNGQFRLKPVLHAGQVTLNSTSISGKIVDSVTNASISGGKTVVALEKVDENGISRVIMETVPDLSGNFTFCPVSDGTYNVVAVAINGQGVAYGATVTTGVRPGNALGSIPLVATTGTSTAPATLKGKVTTANVSNAGTSADISLSTLQTISSGATSTAITIPQAATTSATLSLATATDMACPSNTQCATYEVQVPALNPNVGAFSSSGTTYSAATGDVTYKVNALAFVPNSGSTPSCTPSEKTSDPQTVTPGATVNVPDLVFTGCQ